jgi:hypothetical protein
VQLKQDRWKVIKMIVSQYYSHWSSAGVTRYIRVRELKPLEAWECRQAGTHGKVFLSGRTIQATIGATISHAIFLSGGLDDGVFARLGRSVSLMARQ